VFLGVHTVQDVHRRKTAVAQSVLVAALAEGLEAGGDLSVDPPRGLLNDTFLLHARDLQPQFTHAEPFPHISIDNFMKHEVAEKLLQDFPPFESANNLNEFGKPGLKAIQPDLRSISPAYVELWKYVCSVEFLEAISQVTDIRNLLCDPTFFGGGTHENKHGQKLDTHIDYNYARDKRWHRRLNVLFYLNKRWHPEWGGRIELSKDPWAPPQEDAKMHRVIDVGFNRAVIFATSEYSWHGFKKVQLPADEQAAGTSRKLISLYLYTRNRPPSETAPPHSTQYIPDHPSPTSDRACQLSRSDASCELASYHSWVRPQLTSYFKGEVEQSSINLRLQAAVVEATLGSRVHGEVKLVDKAAGCGQNLNDPWFETSAWFEVRPRRGHEVHRVNYTIDFGSIPFVNRLAGNMVNVRVLAERGHSISVAGSASVLAERSGTRSFSIPLKNACQRQCVLTTFFQTPAEGNYVGSDVRSLAFLLNSATFVSTPSRRRLKLQDNFK
jgi:hypothetical protein